jgi:HSP20 family protein
MKATLEPKTANPSTTAVARPVRRFVTPEVNIFESGDGWTLQAEMPGVSKDGLEVTLEGNELTLVGHKSVEQPNAEALWRESHQADYRRVFELDPSVDTAKISAHMEQGVLTLHLPKAERVKPRRIQVTE